MTEHPAPEPVDLIVSADAGRDAHHSHAGRASDLLPAIKPLTRSVRLACLAASIGLIAAAVLAVFQADNELGTLGLLLVGGISAIVALTGHVPRLKWGDNEIDPSVYYYAGQVEGTEAAVERARQISDHAGTPAEVAADLENFERYVVAQGRGALARAARAERSAPVREARDAASPDADDLDDGEHLDQILERFATFDPSADHGAVFEAMRAMRYEPSPPQARGGGPSGSAYIRWVFKGVNGSIRLYQNSAGLVSDSVPQAKIAVERGIVPPDDRVRPRLTFYYAATSVEEVLAVAMSFRDAVA